MSRPRLLDLFCCEGGAGMGYSRAGFEVVGVDVAPRPRYPFEFILEDAVTFLDRSRNLDGFDAIHASPPCQGYTGMVAPGQKGAPRMIRLVREMLEAAGLPYIIENVEGAADEMPGALTLCGSMFGLGAQGHQLQRHRLFIANFPISAPGPCNHGGPVIGVYGGHARRRSAKHGSRRARAQEAYRRAYERHCSAVNRGDTRSIHETRPALLAAQVRRLKVGA
jgi:DNA (cytosine-5)-methyltransferase 1